MITIDQLTEDQIREAVQYAIDHGFLPGDAQPEASLGRARVCSRKRHLNARGRGTEEFRLAVVDGRTMWLDQAPDVLVVSDDWCARGIRASERKCSTLCETPAGLLVINVDKPIGGRGGRPSYAVGITTPPAEDAEYGSIAWESDERCPVQHVGVKAGNVHVLRRKASGERFEVSPA